jgi:nitroimidazol reductase NimA-like FMN-containing flavoprotein (pyridoxamine 5'-phosphate oxidase superfamily)
MLEDSQRYGEYAMSNEELKAFCASELQAVLASLRKDGRPFAIPLGYLFDGSDFWITGAEGRALAPRLRRRPEVCLTIFGHEVLPTKFAIVEGIAEEVPDPANEMSKRIYAQGSSLMAAKRINVEKFMASWTAVGRIVFKIRVTNLITYDGSKTPKAEKYTTGTGMPGDRRSPQPSGAQ